MKKIKYYSIVLILATLIPIPFSFYSHAKFSVYDKDGNIAEGGLEITLDIDEEYYLHSAAENDSSIQLALEIAKKQRDDTTEDLLSRFYNKYQELYYDSILAPSFFMNDKINNLYNNDEVYYTLREMAYLNLDIINQRLTLGSKLMGFRYKIDSEALENMVVLCDRVKDPDRVVRTLTKQGSFGIWLIEDYQEVSDLLYTVGTLYPSIYNIIQMNVTRNDGRIGIVQSQDTAEVSRLLKAATEEGIINYRLIKFLWSEKPVVSSKGRDFYALYPIHITTRNRGPMLDGGVITDVTNKRNIVNISLNNEGGREWKEITRENVGHNIAIVIDDQVSSSFAPKDENSNDIIKFEVSSSQEAEDLSMILKTGELHISSFQIAKR